MKITNKEVWTKAIEITESFHLSTAGAVPSIDVRNRVLREVVTALEAPRDAAQSKEKPDAGK